MRREALAKRPPEPVPPPVAIALAGVAHGASFNIERSRMGFKEEVRLWPLAPSTLG
jgi:hypothetical protein